VLATLEPLTRSGLLPESAARQLRLNAEINRVKTIAAGAQHLEETWRRMPDEIRLEAAMAGAVAKRLIGLGEGERARQVIEEAVERRGAHHWDSTLAALYAKCNTESTLQQIERAESWLHAQPRDAALLATLGTLCMRASLWGKAQSYLEASVALQPTLDAHMTLARLMEQLGRREEAITHIRRSAELAGA
jgi:HemY protein